MSKTEKAAAAEAANADKTPAAEEVQIRLVVDKPCTLSKLGVEVLPGAVVFAGEAFARQLEAGGYAHRTGF